MTQAGSMIGEGMAAEALVQCALTEFAIDVRLGLTKKGQKELPSKYLYDEVGSALFEVITVLPEYGLFRADERLLRENAGTIAATLLPGPVVVAELGSGSGRKSFWILDSVAKQQPTVYHPIEISQKALERCARELGQLPNVAVTPVQQTYLEGLLSVAAARRPGDQLLVLFLGSTIGNFSGYAAERFLTEVRQALTAEDLLLLSADLEKPAAQLLPAYDDPLGVTASFDLNVLARMNRELDANFDLSAFRHLARYDAGERRIEMHLVSRRPQTVAIPRARCSVSFVEGESIWTESSHKYRPDEVTEMGRRSGFRPLRQWIDREWAFVQALFVAE
jgi:dimethylhistidine N-methyltransferase